MYYVLKDADVDLIILTGYLKLIPVKVIREFTIINTHPALLPKYGGKGMYGMNVHRTVVENHETETGATLHFVNEEYDKGKEDVSLKVQTKEKIQLVKVLRKFSMGKIDIYNFIKVLYFIGDCNESNKYKRTFCYIDKRWS